MEHGEVAKTDRCFDPNHHLIENKMTSFSTGVQCGVGSE